MLRRPYLGEFELMVMLALMRLGEESYGVPIARELKAAIGREAALASIYAALGRLERKGLVVSRLGDPTPERGGRAKLYFRVTPQGLREVNRTRNALTRLWKPIPRLEAQHT